MRHRELKVGMNIIGKPNNGYAITNQYTTCKVLQVNGLNEEILVEVIQSNDNNRVGTRWAVDYKRFVKANVNIPDTKDKIPIPFPIGSYIVGNSKNHYGCTCKGAVCKVIEYKDFLYNERLGLDSEYMRVKIVDKDGTLRESTYIVKPSLFDACDFKPYTGLFSKAYYKKLFIISDDLIKVDGVNKDSPCYNQLIKECVDNGLMKKGE